MPAENPAGAANTQGTCTQTTRLNAHATINATDLNIANRLLVENANQEKHGNLSPFTASTSWVNKIRKGSECWSLNMLPGICQRILLQDRNILISWGLAGGIIRLEAYKKPA
jgi:hypothetical protein